MRIFNPLPLIICEAQVNFPQLADHLTQVCLIRLKIPENANSVQSLVLIDVNGSFCWGVKKPLSISEMQQQNKQLDSPTSSRLSLSFYHYFSSFYL